MQTMTVEELLDRSANFERQLEAYYADIRDRSPDNGVRLLTYYLARHRRHQQTALEGIDEAREENARRMDVTIDVASIPVMEPSTPDRAPETITGKDLIETAVGYDHAVVAMYRSILDQPLHDDARTILEALIREEERDIVLLKKMQAMQYF